MWSASVCGVRRGATVAVAAPPRSDRLLLLRLCTPASLRHRHFHLGRAALASSPVKPPPSPPSASTLNSPPRKPATIPRPPSSPPSPRTASISPSSPPSLSNPPRSARPVPQPPAATSATRPTSPFSPVSHSATAATASPPSASPTPPPPPSPPVPSFTLSQRAPQSSATSAPSSTPAVAAAPAPTFSPPSPTPSFQASPPSSTPPPSPPSPPAGPPPPPTAGAAAAPSPAPPVYSLAFEQGWHFLPVKPPSSSSAPLPFPPIKPPPLHAPLPPQPQYGSSVFPWRPFLVMLLLSVPFALLARDDWRQQAISLTPSLPWPEWMRTEALRFDRLSMEERRRRRVEGWQKEEAEAELDRLEQSLKGARALMKEEKEWERRQESPEQRETRAAAERERAELERQVAEMEDKVKCLIKRQEEEVTAEVESSEIRLRDSFRSRLAEKAEEVSGALERRLQEAVAVVEREAEAELSGRVGAEVQQAREAELERGVTRINARLQADEEAIQQQAQRMMEEEAQRMAAYYEQEKSRLHPLLDWARAEERAMQTEYAEMRQLHFLSTNIHRLNVLILAIDAALHPPPSPDATAAAPPLTQPWSQLTALARADPVLTVAAESIPPALLSSPPPSFDILQVAFAQLERRLLTAIYSPPPSSSPSLLSHLLAHVFSLLTIPHAQLLPATDDWSRLCRLRWLLYEDAEKDIGRVVAEADGMEGVEARAVLAEWMKPARERAMVEQAVTLVKTRVKALELNMVATTIGEGERP